MKTIVAVAADSEGAVVVTDPLEEAVVDSVEAEEMMVSKIYLIYFKYDGI